MGLFFRDGALSFTPGVRDQATFIFYPDTTPFKLHREPQLPHDRVKLDYTVRPHHGLEFKTGVLASLTRGMRTSSTVDSAGTPAPRRIRASREATSESTPRPRSQPSDRWSSDRGAVRQSQCPVRGNKHQVSPRVKLSFFPTRQTRCTCITHGSSSRPTSKICARSRAWPTAAL